MSARLTVIIPIWNVELYLQQCLTSVAEQDFKHMEVILIDDGSTDRSSFIAQEFVEQDSRFRYLHQENKGLGAARNAGLEYATSSVEYLAFVDSDDALPRTAYSNLVASLDASGSDISAGIMERFSSLERCQLVKHARAFVRSRSRTNISEVPDLVMDRTVCNKVYRRSFWDRCDLSFPQGMLYEDAPVAIPLYYMANSVDIISEVVYCYRVREGGEPSITQQPSVSAMLDRFAAIDLVRIFLEVRAKVSPSWLLSYDRNILVEEIPLFFDDLMKMDDAYRRVFVRRSAMLLERISRSLLAELPRPLQEIYSAICAGRSCDLINLLNGIIDNPYWRQRMTMPLHR